VSALFLITAVLLSLIKQTARRIVLGANERSPRSRHYSTTVFPATYTFF
jgi:hypothetical protein